MGDDVDTHSSSTDATSTTWTTIDTATTESGTGDDDFNTLAVWLGSMSAYVVLIAVWLSFVFYFERLFARSMRVTLAYHITVAALSLGGKAEHDPSVMCKCGTILQPGSPGSSTCTSRRRTARSTPSPRSST